MAATCSAAPSVLKVGTALRLKVAGRRPAHVRPLPGELWCCAMTQSVPSPSASAVRRALTRAERGVSLDAVEAETLLHARGLGEGEPLDRLLTAAGRVRDAGLASAGDRKSTRLNSSHLVISYAVFCL